MLRGYKGTESLVLIRDAPLWAGGLAVMMSPLQGEGRRFKSCPAHFLFLQTFLNSGYKPINSRFVDAWG